MEDPSLKSWDEVNAAAKLTKIEQDMANLKICYELTPTELKTTHICPHFSPFWRAYGIPGQPSDA